MRSGDPTADRAGGRAVRAGLLGNYVDQFDIFVPVIALAPIAAQLYGPADAARAAGLVFIATLLGRPLGAVVFGPLADRLGRASTARLALAGVGVTTAIIAAAPAQHGALTVALVLGARFVGGIFLGGSYTAAVPLALEWTPVARRGRVSGSIMAMSPAANATIAALVLVLTLIAGPAAYATWGWRVPFVIGAAMALGTAALYRLRIVDPPREPQDRPSRTPLRDMVGAQHRRTMLQLFLLMTGLWLFTDMAVPVLTGQLITIRHESGTTLSLGLLAATLVSAAAMVGFGALSSRIGRRRFYIGFGLLAIPVAPAIYLSVFLPGSGWWILLAAALQVVTVAAYGPVGAYLTERFPRSVRSTGYGLAYSASIVLPALYPYYLPPLQQLLGPQTAVAALLATAALLLATGAACGQGADPATPTASPARTAVSEAALPREHGEGRP